MFFRKPQEEGPAPPDPKAIASTLDLLEQVLPPIQIRVRRAHVRVLAERVVRIADPAEGWGMNALAAESWCEGLIDPQKPLAMASLVVLLIRMVGLVHLELAEVEREVAGQVEAYARADGDEGRRRRLEAMIDATARNRKRAREDRRALKRYLDLDALRERYDQRRDLLLVQIELAIMASGPAVEKALAAAGRSRTARADVADLLQSAEPIRFIIEQLGLLRRWPTRLACLESLERMLDSLGMPTPILRSSGHRGESIPMLAEVCECLGGIGRDRNDHEWVQAKAIVCLRRVDAGLARELMAHRLGLEGEVPDPWPKRDFLLRRLIIAELCSRAKDPADLALLLRALEHGDASEHTRMAHCEALMALASVRPGAVATWARFLTRTEDENGVELPRVRARACLALSEAFENALERADDATLDEIALAVVDSLATSIANDREALVARIACEQAVILIEQLVRHPRTQGSPRIEEHAARFEEALHACVNDTKRSASIHDAAATAIEGIDTALRPERAAWTEALAKAIDQVHSGSEGKVPLPDHQGKKPNEEELARIFAVLTRNDWGLDVEPKGEVLRVRRGDHRVTRLWRVIHELRHPANNKRQAFRHTTGRSYVHKLRAHPARLDEVTATVVPGERLHLDAEGGWGRHLPMVDDLFGLPWITGRDRLVTLTSSHGRTRMRLLGSFGQRIKRRLRLNLRYAELAEFRRRALLAEEPIERRRFLEILRNDYGVEVDFEPHPSLSLALRGEQQLTRPMPMRLAALFPSLRHLFPNPDEAPPPGEGEGDAAGEGEGDAAGEGEGEGEAEATSEGEASGEAQAEAPAPSSPAPLVLAPPIGLAAWAPDAGNWLRDNLHYFLTLEGNSQDALGLYALGLATLFLGSGYFRRRRIANARAAIPLSVGGWGTRGKSGTERLKAGLFHGIGFRTFSKTTGCEAMFIHAAPGGPQVEIFTFRPYGKATIWEQRDLLTLAAGLEAEVFLWECMALNPEYVDILQRGWMRDDYATITNTYPDHEDIQGPAGIDVAGVIGNFVPEGNLVISSELGFNPILRDSARRRGAEFIEIGDYEGDLLADDLLSLFPYSEHPRNIALVTEMARQLGLDPELSIVCMADYVYPDLGVLKRYPLVEVRGRRIEFVNGCSANERAGFLNNWKRTGCVNLAAAGNPEQMVITVVNNRDDRVSRSEVFSRILVNDVAVDAHVLIGTNLSGLSIFIDRALDNFVSEQELVDAEGLQVGGSGHERARTRLRALMARVRAPTDDWWDKLSTLIRLGFAAMARRFDPDGAEAKAVHDRVAALRDEDGSLEIEAVKERIGKDPGLTGALDKLFAASASAPELAARWEVGAAPTFEDFRGHLDDRMARMIIAGRLAKSLETVLAARDLPGLTALTAAMTKAWIACFKAQLVIVWDASATGDQIIDRLARAVPPGVHVTVMGTQNIKGTGLDFIYRWLALDAVCIGLSKLESSDEQTRFDALRALDAHSDFGFTDTGMMVARLPEFTGGSALEVAQRKALLEKAKIIHQQKLAKLASSVGGAAAKGGKFWTSVEAWIDFIDGAVRYRQSRALVQDLIDYRVSHNKMAVEMREIYARAKGGWLGKYLSAKIGLKKSGGDDEEEKDKDKDKPEQAPGEAPALGEVAAGDEAAEGVVAGEVVAGDVGGSAEGLGEEALIVREVAANDAGARREGPGAGEGAANQGAPADVGEEPSAAAGAAGLAQVPDLEGILERPRKRGRRRSARRRIRAKARPARRRRGRGRGRGRGRRR